METRTAVTSRPLPLTIKLNEIRAYAVIAVFTALSVLTPWAFHQFHLAGATFLPMHFFIFIAALAAGWQAGLIVGLLTPLASYAVSGMPALTVLPQIVVEVAFYGLLAGLLRQKLHLSVIWSLFGAMAGGRLALLAAVSVIQLITGNVYSPLGPAATPFSAVWYTVAQSWPGMLAQLVLIPLGFWLYARFSRRKRTT
ncbi:MAG: ECF transporter S component [Dehalococcoidales bacterium]